MKHKRRSLCCLMLYDALGECCGQPSESAESRFFAGLGLGLDYGGYGLRLDGRITPHTRLFFGLGTTFKFMGYNGGVHARILPAKRLCPYATAMYGFNAEGTGVDGDQLFFGPSFGAGLEWMNFIRIGALFPVYSEEVREVFENEDVHLTPVVISFGFQLALCKPRPEE